MDNGMYNSEIELNRYCLDVILNYESPATKEEAEAALDYFQYKFSQKAGREIPREEINTNINERDIKDRRTRFRVKLRGDLYVGLGNIHQEAPYVLPNLIEDLEKYIGEHNLQDAETRLINQTVKDLRKIIES